MKDNKKYNIFLCYRANTAILAKNFYEYVRRINYSLSDTRYFGNVYYSDGVALGNYRNYQELKKIMKKVRYFVVFLDKNFRDGFIVDNKINPNCVTAHEVKCALELNKEIIVINIEGYNFERSFSTTKSTSTNVNEQEIHKSEAKILELLKIRFASETKYYSQLFMDKEDEAERIKLAEKLTAGNNINNFDIRQGNETDLFERLLDSIDTVKVDEKIASLGIYPQGKVSKEKELELLQSRKINQSINDWKYYDCYFNGKQFDTMKYNDFIDNNHKLYRGVYIEKFRPCMSYGLPYSYQDVNKYERNKCYYFKYEPLKWRILYENEDLIFMSTMKVIDSQPFNDGRSVIEELNCDIKINEFDNSSLCLWLNNDFLNLALPDWIDCLNYFDNGKKVSILSVDDVENFLATQKRRKIAPTDYALAQGVYVYNGICDWGLKDPADNNVDIKFICGNKFDEIKEDFAMYTNGGCCPCIKLDKSKVELKLVNGEYIVEKKVGN